jgi:hypothetical protein
MTAALEPSGVDSTHVSTDYLAGYSDGYRAAISVLDEAGAFLSTLKPSQALDVAAARGRRDTYPTPAQTAAQIRADAYISWGLPDTGSDQVTIDGDAAVDGKGP